MKKIAIITAMESECQKINSLYDFYAAPNGWQADLPNKTLLLIKCGIGKVNTAIATERACRQGADLVISLGIAGGLDPSLKQGDTVVSDRVCYHDVWCGEPNKLGQVQELPLYYEAPLAKGLSFTDTSIKKGLIITGDQFITGEEKLFQLKKDFPEALAVDMESAAIAQTCYLNSVSFLSVRVISDVVGVHNQEDMYYDFWKTCPHILAEKANAILATI